MGYLEPSKLVNNQFIDLHFHILPGVDDGARNLEMALAMARLAVTDGTGVIVATPHPNSQSGVGSHNFTTTLVANLNNTLKEEGISDLKILPGVECYLVPEILVLLKEGNLTSLNGSRYILVEFNTVVPPINIEHVMFQLRAEGYVPIIAHPERYKYVQQDVRWLERLIRLGCLGQVTAGALRGRFGKNCQKAAEELVRFSLVHLVASDAHNVQVRPPGIALARSSIEHLVGPGVFEHMAIELPARIIANLAYEPLRPETSSGRSMWKFWKW